MLKNLQILTCLVSWLQNQLSIKYDSYGCFLLEYLFQVVSPESQYFSTLLANLSKVIVTRPYRWVSVSQRTVNVFVLLLKFLLRLFKVTSQNRSVLGEKTRVQIDKTYTFYIDFAFINFISLYNQIQQGSLVSSSYGYIRYLVRLLLFISINRSCEVASKFDHFKVFRFFINQLRVEESLTRAKEQEYLTP